MTESVIAARRPARNPLHSTPTAVVGVDPDGRDRYVDLLRAVAMVAVVVGHWLVVVPTFHDGTFDGMNALESVPAMRYLTWAFQVMPLFFIVGGVANAHSWRGARARGTSYGAWLGTRVHRLVVPALWLVGVWVIVGVLLRVMGVAPSQVQMLAWVPVVPLWFLAVYLLVAASAPLMLAVHDRGTWPALAGLATWVVVVDRLRFVNGTGWITYTNFLGVFLFAQQLGFLWVDGRVPRRRSTAAMLAVGSAAAMVALCTGGPYPVSLVGVPGEDVQNNAPPTVMLLIAGVMQLGVALAARAWVAPALEHRRAWRAVVVLNVNAMTILLWHFTALVLGAAVVLPWGIVPDHAAGSAPWWSVRLTTVLILAVPMVGLLRVFGPIELRSRRGSGSGPGPRWPRPRGPRLLGPRLLATRALVASALLAVGFALVTTGGLSRSDAVLGIPLVPLVLLGAGAGVNPAPGLTRAAATREGR